MQSNLPKSLQYLYVSEGGYSNDAHDPGGPTKLGVIQSEYDAYRRHRSLPARSVRYIEMPEVEEIYKFQYWDRVRGDELPSGVDYIVFDDAVNTGPRQAIKNLQRALNKLGNELVVDGVLGLLTMTAIKDADSARLIQRYALTRMSFYRAIPGWRYFGIGWTHRLYGQGHDQGVVKNALSMVVQDTTSIVTTTLPQPVPAGYQTFWSAVWTFAKALFSEAAKQQFQAAKAPR
jgi:lysozyme family protein